MHRLLFIGVGGTGGKALRFAWREIDNRMRRARKQTQSSEADMPAAFHFIHFDLPEQFDGYKDKDVPRILSLDDRMYRHLAERPLPYRDYDETLVADGLLRSLWGWRPHPPDLIPPPYVGAGQRRSVGRAVTICGLEQIDTALIHAANVLTSTDANRAVATLDKLFNPSQELSQKLGHVFVVGSIAGGSGSGMFLDVIERVKAYPVDWFSNIHLIAITPDAFLSGPEGEREGIEPNSFAALSEYVTAFLWEGGLHRDESLIQGSAGAVGGTGQRTGTHNFFVGAGNDSGAAFRQPADVYRCVGKSLAAYATTPEIQSYFDVVVCNLNGAEARSGFFFADKGASIYQPAGGFGFGTVAVGGEVLGEYAAQRLARACMERLLCQDTGDQSLDEYIATRTEGDARDRFFQASGLWEFDETSQNVAGGDAAERFHDQVLDALRDVNALMEETEALKKRFLNRLSEDALALTGEQANKETASSFKIDAEAYESTARDRRWERARKWTLDVQGQLLDATISVSSRDGLPVAVRLLRALIEQIDAAAAQLDAERTKAILREDSALRNVATLYSKIRGQITGASDTHKDAAKYRHSALFQRLENHARDEAARLIRDARDNLVAPLLAGLDAYAKKLEQERRDMRGAGAIAERWPRDAVPESLMPAPNEFLLRPAAEAPEELERLLVATTRRPAPKDAFFQAVAEIISGAWPDSRMPGDAVGGAGRFFDADASWNSQLSFAQREGEGVSKAQFPVRAGLLDLLDRAREWVDFRAGALSTVVNETLDKYLDAGHPDHITRAERFAIELTNAGSFARPLVTIDASIRNQVHGDTTETSFTMTPLPLSEKHPARQRIESVLIALGINPEDTGKYFTTDPGAREIDVFGFMTKLVHPVVITSLMHPIASAWSKAGTSVEGRRAFWTFRRARTLEMFIPLRPSDQRAIVKGWYVAALLGYLGGLDGSGENEVQPKVWGPDGWLAFPSPLLGRPVYNRRDVLPALLESFPLCILEASRGTRESRDAYGRLLRLGGAGSTRDGGGPSELERWIQDGIRPSGKGEEPPPPAVFKSTTESPAAWGGNGAGNGHDAAETRRQAVLDALAAPRKTYEAVRDTAPDPDMYVPDRRWEIAGLVLAALDELSRAIQATASIPPVEEAIDV